MNPESFQTYRHSGRFGVHGPILAIVSAAAVAFPLGFAYSYLIKWIPIIYVNFLATFGYGIVFGFIGAKLMKHAVVRNTGVAAVTGLLMGTIALYGAWNGHAHTLVDGLPVLCGPGILIRVIKVLYENGSWGMHSGGAVTGIPLAIVWVAEASIIVGAATVGCVKVVQDTPYCETSQCWLDQTRKIDTLATFTDEAQLASFKAGDLGPLLQAKPKAEQAGAWTRLTLKHSPKCEVFHTIRIQDVHLVADKNGVFQEKVKDLTNDLVLPATMFELITKFENFKLPPIPTPDKPAESA